MADVLAKGRKLETDMHAVRMSHKDGDRDYSSVSESQATPD